MDYSTAASMGSAVGQMAATYFGNQANQINANAANYVRAKNNEVLTVTNARDASLTAIQRWKQSVNNTRVQQNASNDHDVIETNYWRQVDQRQRASFSDQIRSAESEGRQAAMAAVSGVSGGVVDMLNNTAKLRQGMQDVAAATADKQMAYDKNRQEFSNYWANMDQMDYSLILDNPQVMDYTKTVPQPKGMLSGVAAKDVKNIAQGVSFMFKTPDTPTGAINNYSGTDAGYFDGGSNFG